MEAEPDKENGHLDHLEESEEITDQDNKNQRNLTNKYIAIQSGIPKFNLSRREKDEEIT
jgi:hypothetical protein